jgi:uncharacterized phage protein gp47/JayE
MSFTVRSLDEISKTVRGAIRQYLPGTDASLRQNVLYVIGKMVALLAHEYELRLEWIWRQLFLSTASGEAMIRQHAAELGLFAKPASPASGVIEGVAAASTTYPAGVRFVSGGFTYVTVEAFTANAIGEFSVTVTAEQNGAAGNRDAGAILLIADASLWPTIDEEAVVNADGLGAGADAESAEALRRRALKVKASPPQGGALSDYENWALEVPGVAAVWAANFATGTGAIGAWILVEARENGIPIQADLDAVEAHIADKRIVRGSFAAAAPVAKPVDLTVSLTPDTVDHRAAVTAALAAFFDARLTASRVRPGLPADPFTLPRAWISEVISVTQGEASHTLTEPAVNPVFQPGELPVLGAITWAA